MNMLPLALRNAKRQPKRTAYTAIAIILSVIAITFLDGYMRGMTDNVFSTFIRLDAGHIKLMPHSAVNSAMFVPLDEGLQGVDELVSIAESVEGVTDVSARIRFPVMLDKEDGIIPAMGVALYPSREHNIMNLEDFLVEGRLPADSSSEVLIGSKLAEELGLNIGDELFMVASNSYGGLGPGLYNVVGKFSTGINMLDKKQFFVPLSEAQYQLVMDDMAVEIVILVEDGINNTEAVMIPLQEKLKAAGRDDVACVPWKKQGVIYQSIAPLKYFSFVTMILMGIIAGTTVINTVLMSVIERTKELGMLRALGFNRKQVLRLVLTESMVIGLIATLAGFALGLLLTTLIGHIGIDYSKMTDSLESMNLPFKPIIYPRASLVTAIQACLFGFFVSILAAWYPARVAVRMKPVEALRS